MENHQAEVIVVDLQWGSKMSDVLLKVEDLTRRFVSGDESLTVLNHINLEIKRGEMVAIVGASGSGKSTLMNVLGCLDKPSSGRYFINGQDVSTLESEDRKSVV